jgi:hypothetical protein
MCSVTLPTAANKWPPSPRNPWPASVGIRSSRIACLTMVFKPGVMSAQTHWRALNGPRSIADVIEGVKFEDRIQEGSRLSFGFKPNS